MLLFVFVKDMKKRERKRELTWVLCRMGLCMGWVSRMHEKDILNLGLTARTMTAGFENQNPADSGEKNR